jgi:hypothetical protein
MKGVADEKMQLALKVLTCWIDEQAPSPEDIQQLRSFKPELDYLDPDELACVVMREHQTQSSAG